jgi:hypothetical protein
MRVCLGVLLIPMQDNQLVCYRTHTTPETHRMIRESMHLSVHIQETKKGRYCLKTFIVTPKLTWAQAHAIAHLSRQK